MFYCIYKAYILSIYNVVTLKTFMRSEFLCVSVLRVASGPRVKLASCKSALTPGGLPY